MRAMRQSLRSTWSPPPGDCNRDCPSHYRSGVALRSGSVWAGFSGIHKCPYDVWGDTVNMAARVEAASHPNRVWVSAVTANMLGADFDLDGPHSIDTKEARAVETFFINRRQ